MNTLPVLGPFERKVMAEVLGIEPKSVYSTAGNMKPRTLNYRAEALNGVEFGSLRGWYLFASKCKQNEYVLVNLETVGRSFVREGIEAVSKMFGESWHVVTAFVRGEPAGAKVLEILAQNSSLKIREKGKGPSTATRKRVEKARGKKGKR